MVVIVDVIEPVFEAGAVIQHASVTEVLVENDVVVEETNLNNHSVIEVVESGGYVANVQWGFDFPPAPREGQIFIKVTP